MPALPVASPPASLRRPSSAAASRLLALIAALALLSPALVSAGLWTAPPAAAGVTDEQLAQGGVLRDSQEYRVAPGLDLTTFSRLEDKGWNQGSVLTADLRESSLSMDVADTGAVTSRAPVTEIMRSGENGERAVAAVNGTFFDMNRSDAPIYTTISRENGIRVGNPSARPTLTVQEGKAAIQMLGAGGTVTLPDGTRHDLGGINIPNLGKDRIGVYDQAWGDYTLDRPVSTNDKPSAKIARATVVDGVVTKTSGLVPSAGAPEIADGEQVLLGRESGADAVASLQVGDRVDLEVKPTQDVEMAIAGSDQILHNGYIITRQDPLITQTHPRTVVGLSRDGAKMFVLVVDGRSSASRGMTLPEAAQLMKDMGAHQALNLDGGGSSTMAARVAGDDGEKIWNSPSDGSPRPVPDALVFYSDAPARDLADVQVETALPRQTSVFPGMGRTLEATGLASDLSPVLAGGSFSAEGPLEVDGADSCRARAIGTASGRGTVSYTADGHTDAVDLQVIGEPVVLRASKRTVSLPDEGASASLTLTGTDADGRSARIETADVQVETSEGFTVEDDGLGSWTVRATGAAETGSLVFRRDGLELTVPLSFGTKEQTVLDLADPAAFTGASDRATGSFAAGEGPEGAPAIDLSYDFTTSASTRGYYLVPKQPVTVEGDALSFTMDVRGDGSGVWPRLQVVDAKGTVTNLDGDHVGFEGWQQVRFTVPAGLPQPLTVQRIRFLETRPDAKYHGDVAVANLRTTTAPQTEAAPERGVHDPALLANGTVAERPQRIAVMSDAQFVARAPESAAVEGARRTLREIRAQKPDLLVINGDLVDEASPADFDLAARIIEEEWDPAIPYVYVPGNHEVMGGKIEEFEKRFGPTRTSRDLGRTRVVTMDSSAGSLGKRGIDQIAELERQLREVAESDTLTGITVFFHHPPSDPLPAKTSQLADQREARAMERLLGEFRRESGKSAAVINGHVGAFHGSAVDGVTYLINGNSGKSPAGTPATGGFTGWTMLGISPGEGLVGSDPTVADRVEWLAAETHPRVDALTLSAPADLPLGAAGEATASFTQDDRTVPVGWPATAQWGGDGVVIADGSETAAQEQELAREDAVVRFNPRTGELTALRPGTATLRVSVNGKTAEATVTVPGKPVKPGKPGKPDHAGKPGKPGHAGKPGKPGHAGEPGKPDHAGKPARPAKSGSSAS